MFVFECPSLCSWVGWHSEVPNPLYPLLLLKASVVNRRKVFVPGSFSEVSARRRGVSWDRKPMAGAVWKQLCSTEPSKGEGDDLPGDHACTHTHTHTQACSSWRMRLKEKATPVWNISQQVCTRVKVQRTSIFSPASYSLKRTFEALAGWYGFAFGAARFVYTYSTIHQLMLWCLEDVTDTHVGGRATEHTTIDVLSMWTPKYATHVTWWNVLVAQLCFYFCCFDVKNPW